MANINHAFSSMATTIVNVLPSIIFAIVIIIIGILIGILVGKLTNKLITKLGIEKTFDKTTAGSAFKSSGLTLIKNRRRISHSIYINYRNNSRDTSTKHWWHSRQLFSFNSKLFTKTTRRNSHCCFWIYSN